MALLNKSSQSYGVSLAMWNYTVMSATRHKWTRPA